MTARLSNFYLTTLLLIALAGCGDTVIRHSPGADGADGVSCEVERLDDGALITCGDGSGVFIADGKDGKDGEDASLPDFTITEQIDPCGDNPGEFDEIILKTAGGEYVAYFEDRGKRFLTILSPGAYRSTDKQNCKFEITEDGEVGEL